MKENRFNREEFDASNIHFLITRCGFDETAAIKTVSLAGQLPQETTEERRVSMDKAIALLNKLINATNN